MLGFLISSLVCAILFAGMTCFDADGLVKANEHCVLSFPGSRQHQTIRDLIHVGNKVILIDFELEKKGNVTSSVSGTRIFPFMWMVTSGKQGSLLDAIQYNTGVLSLWTMNFGVKHSKLYLKETPRGCINSIDPADVKKLIMVLLLNTRETTNPTTVKIYPDENYEVCEKYIQGSKGIAVVKYKCCHVGPNLDIHCITVPDSYLQTLLHSCITLTKVLAFLYFTKLIMRSKRKYQTFVHRLNTPLEIEVTTRRYRPPGASRVKDTLLGDTREFLIPETKLEIPRQNERLSYHLSELKILETKLFKLHAIWFKVEPDKLYGRVNAKYDSVFEFLFLFIFKHFLTFFNQLKPSVEDLKYDEENSLSACCARSESNCTVYSSFGRHIRKCVCLLLFCALPILPFVIHALYFGDNQAYEAYIAAGLHLTYSLPSHRFLFISFFSLKAVRILYILCCIFWCFPLVIYIIQQFTANETIRKASERIFVLNFENPYDKSKFGCCFALSRVFYLFQQDKYSRLSHVQMGLRVLSGILAVLVIVILLIVHSFPTLNIFFRLLFTFFLEIYRTIYMDESKLYPNASWVSFVDNMTLDCFEYTMNRILGVSKIDITTYSTIREYPNISFRNKWDRIYWSVICVLWVVFLFFSVPIWVDLVFLTLEIILFTLIGIIINIRRTAIFLILILFFFLYIRGIFKPFINGLLVFRQSIYRYICEQHMTHSSRRDDEFADANSRNQAFQVIPRSERRKKYSGCHKMTMRGGIPSWKSEQLMLFVDENEGTLIPKKVLLDFATMKNFAASRSLCRNLASTLKMIMMLTIYICLVLLVIKAFQEQFISSFLDEIVVVFLLGTLPVVFKPILFHRYERYDFTQYKSHFLNCCDDVIRNFVQYWSVLDFDVSRDSKENEHLKTDVINGEKNSKCWFKTQSGKYVGIGIRDGFEVPTTSSSSSETDNSDPTVGQGDNAEGTCKRHPESSVTEDVYETDGLVIHKPPTEQQRPLLGCFPCIENSENPDDANTEESNSLYQKCESVDGSEIL